MSALYKKGKEGIADDTIQLSTGVFKAALVRGYTPNTNTHKFVSDVTGGGGGTLVSTSAALTGITQTDGVIDWGNTLFAAVAAGAACAHVIIFQSSAPAGGADVAATAQRLVALWDGNGLPITPNGLDINVTIANAFEI
jgi:hypothetical protein